MKVVNVLKLAYITGLSKKATEFIRKEAFTRHDDSGEPENDIYCMEGFFYDLGTEHITIPSDIQKEIGELIYLCQENGFAWIGIS